MQEPSAGVSPGTNSGRVAELHGILSEKTLTKNCMGTLLNAVVLVGVMKSSIWRAATYQPEVVAV